MKEFNKALLIIDIQDDFTGDKAKMPVDKKQAAEIITNINRMLDGAEKSGITPIYIGNEFSPRDITNIFRNNAAIKGTEGAKIDSRLRIASNYYFAKHKNNSFSNPELDQFLMQKNIRDLYISGLFAEACVYSTIKGALKNNYSVIAITDCIAAKTDKKRDKMIAQYKKAGIKCITAASIT